MHRSATSPHRRGHPTAHRGGLQHDPPSTHRPAHQNAPASTPQPAHQNDRRTRRPARPSDAARRHGCGHRSGAAPRHGCAASRHGCGHRSDGSHRRDVRRTGPPSSRRHARRNDLSTPQPALPDAHRRPGAAPVHRTEDRRRPDHPRRGHRRIRPRHRGSTDGARVPPDRHRSTRCAHDRCRADRHAGRAHHDPCRHRGLHQRDPDDGRHAGRRPDPADRHRAARSPRRIPHESRRRGTRHPIPRRKTHHVRHHRSRRHANPSRRTHHVRHHRRSLRASSRPSTRRASHRRSTRHATPGPSTHHPSRHRSSRHAIGHPSAHHANRRASRHGRGPQPAASRRQAAPDVCSSCAIRCRRTRRTGPGGRRTTAGPTAGRHANALRRHRTRSHPTRDLDAHRVRARRLTHVPTRSVRGSHWCGGHPNRRTPSSTARSPRSADLRVTVLDAQAERTGDRCSCMALSSSHTTAPWSHPAPRRLFLDRRSTTTPRSHRCARGHGAAASPHDVDTTRRREIRHEPKLPRNRKSHPGDGVALSEWCPAASYSPTPWRVQYHRR